MSFYNTCIYVNIFTNKFCIYCIQIDS